MNNGAASEACHVCEDEDDCADVKSVEDLVLLLSSLHFDASRALRQGRT